MDPANAGSLRRRAALGFDIGAKPRAASGSVAFEDNLGNETGKRGELIIREQFGSVDMVDVTWNGITGHNWLLH